MLQNGTVLESLRSRTGENSLMRGGFGSEHRGPSVMANWKRENIGRRIAIEVSISRVFAVPVQALRSATRGRAHVALARQTAMYLAHVVCGLSLTEVGRIFERDRTTVSHACALIEDRRDELVFDQLLELLERVAREEVRRRTGQDQAVAVPRELIRRN